MKKERKKKKNAKSSIDKISLRLLIQHQDSRENFVTMKSKGNLPLKNAQFHQLLLNVRPNFSFIIKPTLSFCLMYFSTREIQ